MNALAQLQAAGVSVWLDTLSRDLLDSGKFSTLLAELGVTGATSNPTIFAGALADSDRYDDQLRQLTASGVHDPKELFFHLALHDVGRAADLLRPTYEASAGTDGFVSFQCTPDLAGSTVRTVSQALVLWQRLDRPNVMIKVPATAAGVPAIAELIARGVNVNVTLLFSVARYGEVIDAFQEGLTRCLAAGRPINTVSSVASFFVSRVDTKADAQLPTDSPLWGQAAVVNAQHAASVQRQRFTSHSWQRLAAAGGRRQRLLWASTAVKNHRYADTKYVAELATPGTIITAPETTLRAFADHGRLGRGLPDTRPDDLLAALGDCGINLERIAAELEAEGLSTFSRSYQQLFDHLRRRVARLADTASSATPAVPAQTPMR
jgi:transaldolase